MTSKLILTFLLIYFFSNKCDETLKKGITVTKINNIQTKNAPKAIGPYSQALKVTNASEILFISGQLPIVNETGLLLSDPAEATKQCLKNISAILKEADMDFKNVVDVTILLKNIHDFPVINEAYTLFLKEPFPARATFQAGALPKDAVVEIKMIAVK